MKLITFSDYDGVTQTVRADQIESVRRPSERVLDNGCLILISGRVHGFYSADTAGHVEHQLAEAE